MTTESQTAAFDHELVIVIYVLGGPGAGKNGVGLFNDDTCTLMNKKYSFCLIRERDTVSSSSRRIPF